MIYIVIQRLVILCLLAQGLVVTGSASEKHLRFLSRNKQKCIHSAKAYRCVEYVSNKSGNTVKFNIHGIGDRLTVHLTGIETPKIKPNRKQSKKSEKCEISRARDLSYLVSDLLNNAREIHLIGPKRRKGKAYISDIVFDRKSLVALLLMHEYGFISNNKDINWCTKPEKITYGNSVFFESKKEKRSKKELKSNT